MFDLGCTQARAKEPAGTENFEIMSERPQIKRAFEIHDYLYFSPNTVASFGGGREDRDIQNGVYRCWW